MKTLTLIIGVLFFNIGIAQWKTKTFETDNGTKLVANCSPTSKSLASGKATFVLTKNWYGMSLQLHLIDSWSDTYGLDYYKELETKFLFTSGKGEEHIYKTTSTGAEKGDGGVYIYYDKEKIMEYFKKYSKVKVSFGNSSFLFSLSGFTASFNKINKS